MFTSLFCYFSIWSINQWHITNLSQIQLLSSWICFKEVYSAIQSNLCNFVQFSDGLEMLWSEIMCQFIWVRLVISNTSPKKKKPHTSSDLSLSVFGCFPIPHICIWGHIFFEILIQTLIRLLGQSFQSRVQVMHFINLLSILHRCCG